MKYISFLVMGAVSLVFIGLTEVHAQSRTYEQVVLATPAQLSILPKTDGRLMITMGLAEKYIAHHMVTKGDLGDFNRAYGTGIAYGTVQADFSSGTFNIVNKVFSSVDPEGKEGFLITEWVHNIATNGGTGITIGTGKYEGFRATGTYECKSPPNVAPGGWECLNKWKVVKKFPKK